ncbi:MAG: hypothetical protein ACOC3Z_00455, partial [Nanoarchaeota archaeon]
MIKSVDLKNYNTMISKLKKDKNDLIVKKEDEKKTDEFNDTVNRINKIVMISKFIALLSAFIALIIFHKRKVKKLNEKINIYKETIKRMGKRVKKLERLEYLE